MTKQKLNPLRIFFAIMTLLCMVLIFHFSSENADTSTDTSNTFVEIAANICIDDFSEMSPQEQTEIIDSLSFYIRKTAHFTIYAALGFCASMTAGRRKLFGKGSLFTILFCFLYAVSDEIHQSFSPGRSCEFRDVMIDTSGALIGMLCSLASIFILQKISVKIKENRTKRDRME